MRRRIIVVAVVLAAVYLLGGLLAGLLAPSADGALATVLGGWRATLRDGGLILAALALLVPVFAGLRAERVRAWVQPATAEALGAVRMWIATILLASVLWEDLASSAYLPRAMLDVDRHWLVGTLHGLPIGFDRLLASAAGLQVFESAAAILLALAAVGLFTRWTVPAAAVAYLVFASILRSYAWSYHMGLVPLYALLLLAFTPCGDAWSLDRRLRLRRGQAVEPARVPRMRYGIGRFLVWTAVALPYTMAGLSKLRNTGFGWWRGEHMKQMLVSTVVEPMHFDFQVTFLVLRAPGWAWDALGLAALVGEVTFVLVLVSVLARRVLPLVMAGMHVGILLMQNILFPDLIAIQAVFYDWAPLRRRLEAWAGRVTLAGRGAFGGIAARRPALAPALASAGGAAGVASGPARSAPVTGGSASGGDDRTEAGDAPAASARGLSAVSRRQLVVTRVFLAVAFVAWAGRIEKFPLSAMQMFSRREALEPVEYVRPWAVYADGTRAPARFERWIGAMADSRYRRLLRDWEKRPERIAVLREFLDASAERANAAPAPGRRIVRFELEQRRWDFRSHPADPERGSTVYVLTHEVAAGRGG